MPTCSVSFLVKWVPTPRTNNLIMGDSILRTESSFCLTRSTYSYGAPEGCSRALGARIHERISYSQWEPRISRAMTVLSLALLSLSYPVIRVKYSMSTVRLLSVRSLHAWGYFNDIRSICSASIPGHDNTGQLSQTHFHFLRRHSHFRQFFTRGDVLPATQVARWRLTSIRCGDWARDSRWHAHWSMSGDKHLSPAGMS